MQRYATRFTRTVIAALTSRKAARFYRNVGQTLVFAWNLFLLACQVAIAAGSLTRDAWEAFCDWADQYVESCTYHPVEVERVLAPAAAPIALLPAAKPRRTNQVAILQSDRVLITPAPVIEQVASQPQGKRRRGRPKKVA